MLLVLLLSLEDVAPVDVAVGADALQVIFSTKDRENRAFQLVMDIFRYHIWTNKLEKKLPVTLNLFNEINDTLGTIYGS